MKRISTASPGKSPKKTRISVTQVVTSNDYEQVINDTQHQMSMQVSEKEIEIERLVTTVASLSHKCAIVDDRETDVKNIGFRFDDSENQRGSLQTSIHETSVQITTSTSNHQEYQSKLIDQINGLQQSLEAQKQLQYRKDQEYLQEKQSMEARFAADLQRVYTEKEQVRSTLTQQMEQVRSTLTTQMEQVRLSLTQQMEQVRATLTAEREQVSREKEQITQKLLQELEQVRSTLLKQNEQLRVEKDRRILTIETEFEQYRLRSETTITTQNINIQNLKNTIITLEGTVLSQQNEITRLQDVEMQLQQANNAIRQLTEQKYALQKELEHATDYILELEEKVYKANKTSLELLKQLKDAEVEIETLKQYIIDLKQRIAVYIPVKEDATDKKLAEFINNYPERSKLKIMFMRETEGVYQFGTKRVAVKVEKDNIKIRVGGGYLSIDEFLDQYTPVELEKLERKDPLKRFSEKVAIQKTIVNAGVRESSPVTRYAGRSSPGRKTAV